MEMDNEIICKILNQYAYRQRTNWKDNKGSPWNCDFLSLGESPYQVIHIDKDGAIAICEKLIKQSSDDDLKTIVLSITKPLQDEIARLEIELASFRANATALLQAQSEFRHPAFIKVTEQGFTVTGIETKPK